MITESKAISNIQTVQEKLTLGLGTSLNKARIKLMSFLIISLCKVQDVGLYKLANSFETKAKSDSSMRRIQRFLSEVKLDFDKIAAFIFKLLPIAGPYTLTMDRTNWMFGKVDINILFVGIAYNGVAFPLLFTILPKKGNSNTEERVAIVERYIRLFGAESISSLTADREFVGRDWLKYLNSMRIPYHLRVKENFNAVRHGKKMKLKQIFGHLKHGQSLVLDKIYYVNGEACYLSGSRVKDTDGKPELQIIVSYNCPHKSLSRYRLRWQIETCFRGMKTSGFHVESTHLKHLDRIATLFGVMMIAFVWAYLVGLHQDEHFKPIRILNNKRRAKSFLKYGLDLLAAFLYNPFFRPDFDYFQKLSCT